MPTHDPINHPRHYTSHPSGVECIQVVEHFPFNIGAAIKYLWRAGLKGDAIEDLQKAEWYCRREQERRQHERRLAVNWEEIADAWNEGWKVPAISEPKAVDAHSKRHCHPWNPVDLEKGD